MNSQNMRKGLIFAILPLLAVIAAACGGAGGKSTTGSSATAAPTASVIDLSKDALGRSVTLPANPQRIVAMAPTVVELMYAVGATPVGRPSSADYPAAAKSIPDFDTSYEPNTDEITNMKPDLIIADAIIDESKMDTLTQLGAPVFAVRASSFDEVVYSLRVVGAITGHKDEGEKQAKTLEDKLSSILARKPATSPTFLVLIGGGQGVVLAARSNSYIADVITRVGGQNVITTEPDNFRFPGFTEYSMERIIQTDPDVIFAISPGPTKLSDQLAKNPVWSSLKAVRENRVYEVDPVVYLQNAGPRVSQMLDELPRYLYPSLFATGR